MLTIPLNNLILHKKPLQCKSKPLRRITHSKPCRNWRGKLTKHQASTVENSLTVEVITAHLTAAIETGIACTQVTDVLEGHLGKASTRMSSTKGPREETTDQ